MTGLKQKDFREYEDSWNFLLTPLRVGVGTDTGRFRLSSVSDQRQPGGYKTLLP